MFKIDLSGINYISNFQYVAILVLVLMLIYMLIEKLLFIKRSRMFFFVILLSTIATVFDILRASFINKAISLYATSGVVDNLYLNLSNIFSTTYILFLYISLFVFIFYIIEITCGLSYIRNKKYKMALFYLPMIFVLITIFVNYFNTTIYNFLFDEKFVMQINIPFISILISISTLYLVYSIITLHKLKSIFEKRQIAALSLVLPFLGTGVVIEILFNNYLILDFLISICVVLVLTIFETSEDVMDSNSKLYNTNEFIKTIKKAFITKIDHVCILVRINNYSVLTRTYDMSDVNNYTFDVANKVKRMKNEKKIKCDMFSLNNGYYATVFEKPNLGIFGDGYIENLKSDKYCVDFIPDYDVCLIKFLGDFENENDVINFINNFRSTIKFKDDFTIYSNVKNDKDLIIANHLDEIIDTALKENEFVVYYQPIYSIESGKFKTAEALVRLNSKKYGMIPPNAFISYAENAGRIEEIDAYVMEEVFKFVSSETFVALGLEYIEINLSMAECVNPHLIERVRLLMEKYNVDPKKINLEITESFETSEQDLISKNLKKLNEMGFEFSLDDYGTGYSNINRFSNLPISIVKIDKSLVDDCDDKNIRKILDYSFCIVNDLNKKTVVEGVETKEQLERFKNYGANYIQGYYFSKPLDIKAYIEFIRESNK